MARHKSKRRRLRKFYGDRCFYCDRMMDFSEPTRLIGGRVIRMHPHDEATVEHLLDRQHGGRNSYSNLVLSCKRCNNGRNYMSLEEKMASRTASWPLKAIGEPLVHYQNRRNRALRLMKQHRLSRPYPPQVKRK